MIVEKGGGLVQPTPPEEDSLVNHDFYGHAQYHTSYFADTQKDVRRQFTPVPPVVKRMQEPQARLFDSGLTQVGIHLRRGDYGRRIFPIIPVSWYLNWLDRNWSQLVAPSLFIATEDSSLVEAFAKYHPSTVTTYGVKLNAAPMKNFNYLPHDLKHGTRESMDWFPDFYMLSKCNIILGPSSTFSFFAAMLAPNLKSDCRGYWRASLAHEDFIGEDPWNSYPLLRQHCDHYPNLPEIRTVGMNPYWG
jgi:hypothetical protein